MTLKSRDAAIAAFSKLDLSGANLQLAQYWLSLWEEDAIPLRSAFNPAKIKTLLPGIGIFEVRPGESVRCRIAGGNIAQSISREISGQDWREYTPKEHWAARLERNTAIAMGAIGIGIRHGVADAGRMRSIELQLPFGDVAEDGARLMLFHLDWRPGAYTSYRPQSGRTAAIADEFVCIPLTP
jgi:hypothetical protein